MLIGSFLFCTVVRSYGYDKGLETHGFIILDESITYLQILQVELAESQRICNKTKHRDAHSQEPLASWRTCKATEHLIPAAWTDHMKKGTRFKKQKEIVIPIQNSKFSIQTAWDI